MLTQTQKAIIAAIESGHTTTRSIAEAIGMVSNGGVARQLRILARGGHIILEDGPHGATITTLGDYCAGWDAAARLAGQCSTMAEVERLRTAIAAALDDLQDGRPYAGAAVRLRAALGLSGGLP